MLLPALLREARRRRGLSVREAARRCDVPRASWADWEAGRSSPGLARLTAALATLELDLRLVERPDEPSGAEAVRRHLCRSLTDRAREALGSQLGPTIVACCEQPRVLTGPAAVGVWVPHVLARGPLPLPPGPGPTGVVALRLAPIGGGAATALVPTPDMLLAEGAGRCFPGLVTAARLLHAESPLDLAGRRSPPHRDPDEEREARDIAPTLRWGGRGRLPVSAADSRAWRLDAPASLDAVLARQGYPGRHEAQLRGSRP